jgi:hypothetical protein
MTSERSAVGFVSLAVAGGMNLSPGYRGNGREGNGVVGNVAIALMSIALGSVNRGRSRDADVFISYFLCS